MRKGTDMAVDVLSWQNSDTCNILHLSCCKFKGCRPLAHCHWRLRWQYELSRPQGTPQVIALVVCFFLVIPTQQNAQISSIVSFRMLSILVKKPGDILLYESAKNFHGRPCRFKGKWYTSVFVHFYPKEGWNTIDRDLECHFAVPPNWYETQPSAIEKLRWVGASALEPECPNSWCNLRRAKTWEGCVSLENCRILHFLKSTHH